MFDQDDDFDIDEGFLSTISDDIISSTPLSDGTNFVFRKSVLDKIPSPAKTKIHFNNTTKPVSTKIFDNDELTDDSLNLDLEDKQKPSQGNKRAFSELINNENSNQCHINSKLKKFAFSPNKRPVESIIKILQNDEAPNTSSNLDIFKNIQHHSNNQTNENIIEKKNEFNKSCNTKLKQLTSSEQNIHINKTVVNQHNSKTLVQKRKFPGPAGLLPEINNIKEATKLKLPDLEDETVSNITILVPICSQNSESLFTKGPWQQMLNDYGSPDLGSLPGKYTISWLKSTANVRQLIQQKSPFLAAIIDSINDNFNVRLKDQTGEIDGVIEKEVWDSYGDLLNVGSVLVLRQVGVLTFSAKKHYLNITANTIVIIYSNNEENLTVDVTKGLNYVNARDFTNSINNVREENRQNNICKKSVNNAIFKPNFTHYNNNSNSSSSNVMASSSSSRNTGSNFVPQFLKRNTPFMNTNSTKSYTSGPDINRSFQQPSSSSISTPSKKFNFAKFKQSPTNNSIQINQNTKVESNKEDNTDIESIISSTFNGINADSFFDDF